MGFFFSAENLDPLKNTKLNSNDEKCQPIIIMFWVLAKILLLFGHFVFLLKIEMVREKPAFRMEK